MAAEVENTTVITAGMDATDYVTAAGQMVDANTALAASGEAVVAAGDNGDDLADQDHAGDHRRRRGL